MDKQWIALFSRSGKTLADVCERFGTDPAVIYTDNFGSIDPRLLFRSNIFRLSHNSIMRVFRRGYFPNATITLMGYLNILPIDVCTQYNIYNLHPANIIAYPKYKGKDPIERIFDDGCLKALGVVLHRVTPEVDSGEVLQMETYTANTIDSAYEQANSCAVSMWTKLLETEENK